MKKSLTKLSLLSLTLASFMAAAVPAHADVKLPNGLVFGSNIFADYTSYSDNKTPTATVFDANNGFHISRAYLYLKDKIDDNTNARITFDTASTPTAGATIFLKHAYLDYAINENVTVEAGLGGTPWVGFVEKLWGYRSIGDAKGFVAGKVLADKNGALSSADAGVALMGTVGDFNYQAGVYNGEGYNGVANGGGVKAAVRVGYDNLIVPGLGVAAYYDNETKRNGLVGYNPTRTAAIVYYKQPTYTVAAEYLAANDFAVGTAAPVGAKFQDGNGYSVFGNVKVMDNVRLFARYDAMTNNTRVTAPTVAVKATTATVGATLILAPGQEVSLDYSSFNDGAVVSTTSNTLALNLLTGF